MKQAAGWLLGKWSMAKPAVSRAQKAGLYKAGSPQGPGYQRQSEQVQ